MTSKPRRSKILQFRGLLVIGIILASIVVVGIIRFWVKYGSSGSCIPVDEDVGLSVIETRDGGYLVVGYTQSIFALLVKVDANGNIVWNKALNIMSSILTRVICGYEGYIAVGWVAENQNAGLCIKVDEEGNIIWNRTYIEQYPIIIRTIDKTSNNYIAVGNIYYDTNTDIWLARIDVDGNVVWSKTIGGPGNDIGNSIVRASDGYIIAGYTEAGSGDSDLWLLKIDEDGNVVWSKTIGGPGKDIGNSIVRASDGYIIIGGSSQYPGVWIVKVDENGSVVWNGAIGGPADVGYSIAQISDGGYIIVGRSSKYDTGDVLLVKIDKDFHIEWIITYSSFATKG